MQEHVLIEIIDPSSPSNLALVSDFFLFFQSREPHFVEISQNPQFGLVQLESVSTLSKNLIFENCISPTLTHTRVKCSAVQC